MSLSNILSPNGYNLYANNIESKNVDLVTINHQPYPPGGGAIPNPLVANKMLRVNNTGTTMLWGDVSLSNLPGGTVGDVLKTVAPSTVAWDTIKPQDITPGLANQIFHVKSDGSAAEWTSNLTVPGNLDVATGTLHVGGSSVFDSNSQCLQDFVVGGDLIVSDNVTVTNNDLTLINGNLFVDAGSTSLVNTNITGNLQFNGVSGTNGQFLKKTGAGTQAFSNITSTNISPGTDGQALMTRSGFSLWSNILISDITAGLANQIMVTNSAGTSPTWTSNLTVPGITNLLGNLQFNSVSGTTGQFIKKTGVATQAFANIVASDITAGSNNTVLTSAGGVSQWIAPTVINFIKYGTTFTNQNINSAAGPTALSFSTSPFIDSAVATSGVAVNITQPSATQFTIGTTNTYNIDITGFIDSTSTGIGNSVVSLSVEVAGTEKSDYAIVCNANYSFSGRFPGIAIVAGQNIRILARRIAGTNPLNTFTAGTGAPSFASSILIST